MILYYVLLGGRHQNKRSHLKAIDIGNKEPGIILQTLMRNYGNFILVDAIDKPVKPIKFTRLKGMKEV